MSKIVVDARGRACPEPVLMTKKALQDRSASYEVLVDNQTAVENVTRFATNHGWHLEVISQGDEFHLMITG